MSPIEQRVSKALDKIRPYLEADGGDISLVKVTEDKVAWVQLHGACLDCSMSAMTMSAGVEETVKRAVPEIVSVKNMEA